MLAKKRPKTKAQKSKKYTRRFSKENSQFLQNIDRFVGVSVNLDQCATELKLWK